MPDEQGLCRDCGSTCSSHVCPDCGSHRVVSHPELHRLSIAHVDCDAFYASVEKRDRPELRDKPVIVGGGGGRGVVSTACYIARIDGVHSAMPMFKAMRACPNAVVIKPDMKRYAAVSAEIRNLFEAITPAVQPISIDEAFLDLSGTERLHGRSPAKSLVDLARTIERDIGVSVSIGLSHNRFLAKVASDMDKPRGFTVIGKAETHDFLASQPVSILMGVGKSFQATLRRDGITHLSQLQEMEETDLLHRYGNMGGRLYRLSRGIDARAVERDSSRKSLSAERTFSLDIRDQAELETRLWTVCEEVSRRAKDKHIAGRTVTLKLKTSRHKIITRSQTLTAPVLMAHKLFELTRDLLAGELDKHAYRLIGVGISDLVDADMVEEGDLIDHDGRKRSRSERAVDEIRQRFGTTAIGSGRSFKPASPNANKDR